MQFRVLNTPATPTQFNFTALNTALPATYAQSQDPVLVPRGTYAKIFDTSLAGRPLQSKAIAEEFEPRYGRMNALLGTEFWILNNQGQQTNGFTSVDPATEIFNENETQIWKVVHNGVDTHAIHFHLFDVQVINRTDWAGVVKPPDANELGWKETVKMNPLEDIFIAMRPRRPPLPGFGLPNSIRPLDPTMPLGTPSANNPNQTPGWPYPDPLVPVPFTNDLTNFGWEYVWHCHILGHEENDMMRPIVMNVAETLPVAPSNLQATMNAAAPWQAQLEG
jgi:FtsP/CotA-like multicopper oxidase with cupredoxin domain